MYNVYMPYDVLRHVHPRASGLIVYGGGGRKAAPAPTFTSSYPELAGKKYSSKAEKAAAEKKVDDKKIARLQEDLSLTQDIVGSGLSTQQQAVAAAAYTDPASLIKTAEVGEIDMAGTEIAEGTGQVTGAAPVVTPATVLETAQVSAPEEKAAATYTAESITPEIQSFLDTVKAEQGELSPESIIQAIQKDPSTLSQLGLEIGQIGQAVQVQKPADRTIQEGEIISGSAVDMSRVNEALDFEAAQADPTAAATVRGQLETLMADFEGSEPPAWAAGAMRAATAQMVARGIGASSMAGQAIVQAAMESALPIATQDAQTRAQFEAQNLSNRQQTALFAAQQRATFLGMEFDQDFQTRVANSARISEIANLNFTAEQQIALENARLAQTVDLANLEAKNAKIMADAAAMTQLDLTNLNNRQQAAVQNAQNFLQMDLTNLSYAQQTAMFAAQSKVQSLLSDQAAQNAALQFNAASENQTNQFFANLTAQTEQFNASQTNAIAQFNAGEVNAIAQFNSSLQNQREQFNAQNALVVAQANTQWRQNASLAEFTAQNEANMQAAKDTNVLTAASLDQIWQRERDLMDYAFRESESVKDRALQLLLGEQSLEGIDKQLAAKEAADKASFLGTLVGILFGGL